MHSSRSRIVIPIAVLAVLSLAVWWALRPGRPSAPVAVSSPAPAPAAEPSMAAATPAPGLNTPVPVVQPTPYPTIVPQPGVPPRIAARALYAPPVVPGGFTLTERDHLATDLRNVQGSLRSFRTLMGENPWGNNAEITRALLGDNPRNAKLGVPTGSRLNDNGELCDRWGTPYFFHQLSAEQMEVRSAGPDRAMWTDDDLQQ